MTSPRFTLHGVWASGPTYKAGLMLALSGADWRFQHLDMMTGAHKREDYLAPNPFGQAPCLEDADIGGAVLQSPVILEHVADATGTFQPATPADRLRARAWAFWSTDRLVRGVFRPRGVKLGFFKADPAVIAHYEREGDAGLKELDRLLAGKTWLVGETVTFADIDIYGVVAFLEQGGFARADYPSIAAHATRIEAMPGWAGVNDLLPKG